MKQELKLQQNNKGFSLVELIVTILISSVVMLAVVGLLTTGLNLYKNVNAETKLQTEGLAACGRINELVQEAQNLQYYGNVPVAGAGNNNKVLVLMTLEDSGAGWWYYIAWDEIDKMLLLTKDAVSFNAGVLQKPSEDEIKGKVSTMVTADKKKKYLLAQYIETFEFEKQPDAKLYYLNIKLELDGKEFYTSQFINGRNK